MPNLSFDILVDLDGKLAAAHIEELQAKLAEIRDKRVSLEFDGADADVRIKDIKVRLDELAAKHPSIEVRAEAARALADLAAVQAESDRLDGKKVKFTVDDDGSADKSRGSINGLMMAGVALGPAIIPVAAAVAAAVAAIGTGAVAGMAGLGVVTLGFHGVSEAVTELGAAQTTGAAQATQAAAQQISSANSIAGAKDALANATRNVGVAEENAALAVKQASEQAVAAHLAVEHAVEQERNAEQSLTSDLHSVELAQRDLTQARIDAQRALQDETFAVQDNALAQKRAQLDIEAAQKALLSIATTDPRRAGAELTLAENQQRLLELQSTGQRLTEDKTKADAAGVDGSKQVSAAQDTLTQALQRVVAAQQAVQDSTVALTQAHIHEADAVDAVSRAQQTGARQVEAAEQAVTSASRALQSAQAQAAAQTNQAAVAAAGLYAAYNRLTPEGQRFAQFVHSDLAPKLKELQDTAQRGLLPGVEDGIKAAMPLFPQLKGVVGDVAGTLGDMAHRAGEALNNPFWHGFVDYVKAEASPSLTTFGVVLGNLATGGAAILEAFKPVWDQMSAGIKNWSDRFAQASKALQSNPDFQKFLQYVHDNGPLVVHTVEDLGGMFVKIGQSLAPFGPPLLQVVDATAKWVGSMDPSVLGPILVTLGGIFLLYKTYVLGRALYDGIVAIKDATWLWTAAQWALNVAMDANPIGIVIGALTILGLGIYEVVQHWGWFKQKGTEAIHLLGDAWNWVWGNVLKPIGDGIMNNVLRPIGDAFARIPDIVRDTWSRITDFAMAPIRFVVNVVYDGGIVPVWNAIASVFGLGQLAPIKLASGGVLPGYAPGRDSVPAVLSPGEGVLVPEAVKALGPGFVYWANREFSAGRATSSGVNAFADGGVVGAVGGALSGAWDWTGGLLTDPVGTVKRLFSGVLDSAGRIPGTGLLRDALVTLPGKVIDAVIAKAKDFITSVTSSGAGAGVQRWTPMVTQALGIMHQPPGYLGSTLRRMNQESGGNPTAVNKTDINWQYGTPSVGLMQVIAPTYAHNKVIDAGPYLYGVSVDPLANTLASMHYAIGRYGSLPAAYDRPGGYANGGLITRPTLATLGEAGDEVVLPLTRPHRARQLARQAGIGAPVHIEHVHLSEAVDVDLLAERLAFRQTAASF